MEISGFLPTVRRWWWLLAAAMLVSGVAGAVVSSAITPTYEAEVRLLVGPNNADRDILLAAGQLAQTFAELTGSTPLLEETIDTLDVTIPADELRDKVSAGANDVTRVLTIHVRDDDPVLAATLANGLADALIARAGQLPSDAPTTEGAEAPPEASLITVIDEAEPPTSPVAPRRSLIVVLAAMAGLLGAAAVLLLLERLRDAVGSEHELAELGHVDVLGTVDGGSLEPGFPIVARDPGSEEAAAYRMIASRVQAGRTGARSVMVTGAGEPDRGPAAALNLAASLAAAGGDVLVIDAGTDGQLTSSLGLRPNPGALERFERSEFIELEPVSLPDGSEIHVLPADPDLSASVRLPRVRQLLETLLVEETTIVVNCDAIRLSPTPLVWARAVDAVVLVATIERTKREDARLAVESLHAVDATVAGAVLLRPRAGWRRRGGPVPEQRLATERRPRPARPEATTSDATPAPGSPAPAEPAGEHGGEAAPAVPRDR